MAIVPVLAKVGATLLMSMLTEKFIINMLVLILDKLASRWGNDFTKEALNHLKDSLDKDRGTPKNLYSEVKAKTGK